MESRNYKLYLDLDGVLADFDKSALAIFGVAYQGMTGEEWKRVGPPHNNSFFLDLERMHDADVLWDYAKDKNPTILTGVPRGDWAHGQKRAWVARHLGDHLEVICCRSRDKQNHAGPDAILVDDRADNIEQWRAKGGIGILHKSAEQSIAELRTIYGD